MGVYVYAGYYQSKPTIQLILLAIELEVAKAIGMNLPSGNNGWNTTRNKDVRNSQNTIKSYFAMKINKIPPVSTSEQWLCVNLNASNLSSVGI